MVSPTNSHVQVDTTMKFPHAGEVSLPGKQVINTPEKINAIKEQCIVMSEKSKTTASIIARLGPTLILGGLLTSFYIATQGPRGFYNGTSIGGRNVQFDESISLWGISISLGGFGSLMLLPLEKSKHQKLKSMPENLNDEQFINWAEAKEVQLNISNVVEYHSNYRAIIACAEKINRLHDEVI
ncbi:MAG TPA: hypothetical protein VGP47_00605 [Parachlamydiaceae bacterium]|nr:hypothetical protein [Parachlamydiaceae bacterium]